MNAPTTALPTALTVEDVLARGDLSKLSPEQRVEYISRVCASLGLNPLTQPIRFLTLSGRVVPYATRDCADQLRKLHGISTSIVEYRAQDGLLTVRVKATDKDGRVDEDFGVVSIIGLKGESLSNAFMKAVTKAKRRVTLSIAGLGFADESELESFAEPRSINPSLPQSERTRIAEEQHRQQQSEPEPQLEPEAEPHNIDRAGDDAAAWSDWSKRFYAFVKAASTCERINEWINANSDHLAALQQHNAGNYRTLVNMVNHQTAARAELEA